MKWKANVKWKAIAVDSSNCASLLQFKWKATVIQKGVNLNKNIKVEILSLKNKHKKTIKIPWIKMPQLIPFYFFNQIFVSFLVLLGIIYLLSKYILPLNTFQQVIRQYITKLGK
jgi:F-type H+-transporting ATPase subunit 8